MNGMNHEHVFWNEGVTKIALGFLLLAFIGSAAYFAFRLKPGIVPDEITHFLTTRAYATTWGFPADTPQTYALGTLQHQAFAYYWLTARGLNMLHALNPILNEGAQLVFLRLLNVLFSVAGIVFVFLYASEITASREGALFAVFMLVNTLMFVFLSGGANYDNLLNACCFASLYFLTRVFNGHDFVKNSLMWIFFCSFGALVKYTMLPLAAISAALWISYAVRHRASIKLNGKRDAARVALSLLCVLLVVGNIGLYGVNLLRFHGLMPSCTQVLTYAQCMQNANFARNQALALPAKLSVQEAMASGYPDPVRYALLEWLPLMLERVYGILGHQIYYPPLLTTLQLLFIFWIAAVSIRYWKRPPFSVAATYVILLGYLCVLLLLNYNIELGYGFRHIALQGRYAFPVIGIYYAVVARALLSITNTRVRTLSFAAATLLFVLGSPFVTVPLGYHSYFSGWFY